MQVGLDTISAVIAVVALIVAILSWLFPRNPKKKKIPEFSDILTDKSSHLFADFIRKNENEIVKIRSIIPMNEENLLEEGSDEAGDVFHILTLRNKYADGERHGGIELSVNPEKGSTQSPIIFANGGYHLSGCFLIRIHPGVFQGFRSAALTEVSAEQMALRS